MSLRLRLLVLFGGLLAVLVPAEWLLLRTLTKDVSLQVSFVASSVGREVVRVISMNGEPSRIQFTTKVDPSGSRLEQESHLVTTEATEPGGKAQQHVVVRTNCVVGPDGEIQETQVRKDLTPVEAGVAGKPRFLILRGPRVVTRIPIPESGLTTVMDSFRRRLLLGSVAILGVGILAAVVMADRLKEREKEALASRDRQHLGELGEVARGLAHALRNPLHAVGLTLDELAARLPDDSGAEEMAVSARRQIRRVDDSIRSFLALANGGAGVEEVVDLGALVNDVALEALQDCRGRVDVQVRAPEGEPVRLRGIAPELRAVVQALVVNAVEASRDGGCVTVDVRTNEGSAIVAVDDEGPGLPAAVRERLFTPHVTTKPSGSGMGLYLAHRIATTRYGGRLEIAERTPLGTRALLTLGPRTGVRDA